MDGPPDGEQNSLERRSKRNVEMAVQEMQTRLNRRHTMAPRIKPESYVWKKFVSLDGENSTYTTVLLICMNLALLVWFFERRLLEGRHDDLLIDVDGMTVAGRRLFRSLILIFCAAGDGFVAFLLIGLNLRDVNSMSDNVAKKWLFMSGLGLLVANATAAGICYDAHAAFKWRRDEKDSYEKPFPHYMILSVFLCFMVLMNFLYVRTIYLPFVRKKPKGWDFVRRNLQAVQQLGRRETGEASFCEKVMASLTRVLYRIIGFFNFLLYHYLSCFDGILIFMTQLVQDTSCGALKRTSRLVSEVALGPIRLIRWSPLVQVPLFFARSLRRLIESLSRIFEPITDFSKMARYHGHRRDASWHIRLSKGFLAVMDRFVGIFSKFKPAVQETANDLWENIKEDDSYSHSSWLKASVVTAAVLLIYFGVSLVNIYTGYMNDVYLPTRNCMIKNPGVSNFFLRFIGFSPDNGTDSSQEDICLISASTLETATNDPTDADLVSNATGLLTDVAGATGLEPFAAAAGAGADADLLRHYSTQLLQRVEENRTEDRFYSCDNRRREQNVCVILAAVNMAEELLANETDLNSNRQPSDEFFDSFSGEFVYMFDVYLRNLEWSIWVGFVVGLLFGFWTLLSVMGQYKRLSLAIRAGLFTDFDVERHYEVSTTRSQKLGMLRRVNSVIHSHSFAKVIVHYPMSTSIFFSGMLISTAILQLVVFGGLVASIFSLLASLADDEVLEFVKPLLWTLLAFFVTWLVNGPIAVLVIGEGLLVSRFQVIHEILFFLFLLVYTSIHLVVSLFLAFFRMLWVLLSALITINRLDHNLFTIYKERDIGHKSFMALILMQHVFHVNRSGNQDERSLWAEILKKLEDKDVQESLRQSTRMGHVRHISEPMELLDDGNDMDRSANAETSMNSASRRMDQAERGRSPFCGPRDNSLARTNEARSNLSASSPRPSLP